MRWVGGGVLSAKSGAGPRVVVFNGSTAHPHATSCSPPFIDEW